MRHVKVRSTAQSVNDDLCHDKIVVVIDVLRATSVITTALNNGAKAIYPFADIPSAKSYFETFDANTALLCGERQGHIIPGFDLGNAPLSFTPDLIKDKNILLSTTNGSVAITKSSKSKILVAASFLNISAIADFICSTKDDLLIVCAGTNGSFSLDDALCAGMLIGLIEKNEGLAKDDLAVLLQHYGQQKGSLKEKLSQCQHLKYLCSIGYEQDVDYCLTTDLIHTVPLLRTDGKQQWLELFK
jgi:2-phosphosulfolactate phosphatase